MWGYRIGKNLQRLMGRFWEVQTVVARSRGDMVAVYDGAGVTQGDPMSSTTFNIVVDAVVRDTLKEVCGP